MSFLSQCKILQMNKKRKITRNKTIVILWEQNLRDGICRQCDTLRLFLQFSKVVIRAFPLTLLMFPGWARRIVQIVI